MVGEVCDREIAKYSFDSGNSSTNSSTGGESVESLEDAKKLQIAVSLTLLVGVIQVCMTAPRAWFSKKLEFISNVNIENGKQPTAI